MPGLRCLFCQSVNPATSKFCNECGSPTNLRPCFACNAVDSRAAARCYKCGGEFAAPVPVPAEGEAEPVEPPRETFAVEGAAAAVASHPAASAPRPAVLPDALPTRHEVSEDVLAFAPDPVMSHAAPTIERIPDALGSPRESRWSPVSGLGLVAMLAAIALVAAALYREVPEVPASVPRTQAPVPAENSAAPPITVTVPPPEPAASGPARAKAPAPPAGRDTVAYPATPPTPASDAAPAMPAAAPPSAGCAPAVAALGLCGRAPAGKVR